LLLQRRGLELWRAQTPALARLLPPWHFAGLVTPEGRGVLVIGTDGIKEVTLAKGLVRTETQDLQTPVAIWQSECTRVLVKKGWLRHECTLQ
jgi:hypothetical protein